MLHGFKIIIQQVLKNNLINREKTSLIYLKYLVTKMFILIDETKSRYLNVKHVAAKKQLIQCCTKTLTQNLIMTFFAIEKSS